MEPAGQCGKRSSSRSFAIHQPWRRLRPRHCCRAPPINSTSSEKERDLTGSVLGRRIAVNAGNKRNIPCDARTIDCDSDLIYIRETGSKWRRRSATSARWRNIYLLYKHHNWAQLLLDTSRAWNLFRGREKKKKRTDDVRQPFSGDPQGRRTKSLKRVGTRARALSGGKASSKTLPKSR